MTRLSWPLALGLGYFVLAFLGFAVMFAGVFWEFLLEPALNRPWYFLALPLLSLSSLALAGGLGRRMWLARIARIPPAD